MPIGGVESAVYGVEDLAASTKFYDDFGLAPCGGMAEYGADTDYLDDSWVPRVWERSFAGFMWTSRILPFLPEEGPWEISFDKSVLPNGEIPPKSFPLLGGDSSEPTKD